MKSSQYWARRMAQMAQRQMQSAEAVERRVARAYDELMHDLDRELSVFYARYAANEGISMAAARKLLSGAELETFRMTLDEFRDKAKAGGYDRELNEIYLRSRVSRLQALQTQITVRTRALYQSQRDLLHDHIKATYADTFYRTVYEVQRGGRVASTFAKLDTDTVETIISRPWLEGNFSGRVWANRDKLLAELQTTLAQAFTRGDPLDRTASLLAKRMNVAKSRAMALVETESAHFAAQATARGYAETGVKQYDYLATLDERTCDICGPMDGKTFKRSEMQTGINYPPLHTRCRCTTVPHFDDDFGEPGTRAARDPVTGKSVQVPDMTYQEWREKYVDGAAAHDATRNTGKRVHFDERADYSIRIDRYSDAANDAISEANREVARLGTQDGLEHLCLVDVKQGSIVYRETGDENEVGFDAFRRFMREHRDGTYAFIHNHNTDGWLSEADVQTLLTMQSIDAMIAVRADGVIYAAPKNADAKIEKLLDMIYADEVAELRKRAQADDSILFSKERETLLVKNALRDYVKEYAEYDGRKK